MKHASLLLEKIIAIICAISFIILSFEYKSFSKETKNQLLLNLIGIIIWRYLWTSSKIQRTKIQTHLNQQKNISSRRLTVLSKDGRSPVEIQPPPS